MRKAGYSLFELIILIVVLGVVCYFIFLNQDSFSGEKPEEMESIAAELIRVGLHNYGTQSKKSDRLPVFPLKLDAAGANTPASQQNPLFTAIFPEGVKSAWQKVQENQYAFLPSAHGLITPKNTYYYDPVAGTFTKGMPKSRSQTV